MSHSLSARNEKARLQQQAYRKTPEYRKYLETSRARRNALKEKYRRQAGCRLRTEISEESKKKMALKEEVMEKRLVGSLHDAHVRRFQRVMKSREKYKRRYEANPKKERERTAVRKQILCDSYVIQNLKSAGVPLEVITKELIDLKREAMQYARISKVIKTTVKNHLKEENETITKHT